MLKINQDSITPLMQQYNKIKQNYKDAILFFRLGDFYEMFGEDAIKASPILEIVLTKRQNVPMCGVPYHSVSTYLAKLIKKGFKVAICEQLEDSSVAKGIVKREVVRLITPGTLIEENLLKTKTNNYLLAIYCELKNNTDTKDYKIGISYLDISTGDFFMTEIIDDDSLTKLVCELTRINASEYIIPVSLKDTPIGSLLQKFNLVNNFLDDWSFQYSFAVDKICQVYKINSIKSFGIEDKVLGLGASGALLNYLETTHRNNIPPLRIIKYYSTDEYMILDKPAVMNLDLVENSVTKTEENSLLEILDQTSTNMGARLLRRYILQPLTNVDKIKERQETLTFFIENGITRRKLEQLFKQISDISRILSRISTGLANPKDLVALKETLKLVPEIKLLLNNALDTSPNKPRILLSLIENLFELTDIVNLISAAIVDNPHTDLHKPGFIKNGFNPELDELREISNSGKTYLLELEQKERKRTGISSLKIGYTSTFGYYIEVRKPNLHLVPQDYIRKQTLISSERFITDELKRYEEKVLTADEKIIRIEQEIFNQLQKEIVKESFKLHSISDAISEIDVYISLAKVSEQNNYCKPDVNYGYKIEIKEGRHPVLEKKLKTNSFVPNDISIDGAENKIIILTGPNMAGKSTFLRQVALITIMAQIGSYVPAKEASIGIVDRIFTRIGSGDNLVGGESTFMVEMHETAKILYNATPRSLLILDEVGRGTSTFDGISIAWACIEYLSKLTNGNNIGAKVLFATHYFELTDLADKLNGVKNYNVAVREWQDEVIFLYKILPGCADRSYGIQVAKLAGLPNTVIERAKEILSELDKKSEFDSYKLDGKTNEQLNLFLPTYHPILNELEKIDINNTTPLDALKILSHWKKEYLKKND
jgi:DNA mismatch repair protein MutS